MKKQTKCPAVLGILYDVEKRSIVWVRRRDVPVWVLPGGGIDPGETPEEALVREAKEETGLDIVLDRCSAHYTPVNQWAAETFVYLCSVNSGEMKLSDETDAIDWFPIGAPPKNAFPLHTSWVLESLSSKSQVNRPLSEVNGWFLMKTFLRHPMLSLRYFLSDRVKKNIQ